jgi:hypothetical protein
MSKSGKNRAPGRTASPEKAKKVDFFDSALLSDIIFLCKWAPKKKFI